MENKDYDFVWDLLRITEMYVINLQTGDADAVCNRQAGERIENSGNLKWDQILEKRILRHLHPRFTDKMIKMYSLKSMREASERGDKRIKLFCQHVLDEQSHYATATVTASFHKSSTRGDYAVFTLKDVDEYTHKEIRQTQNDRRMAAIIKSRFNVVTTVHLDSGMCERMYLNNEAENGKVHIGNYDYHIQKAMEEAIYEEDVNMFQETFSMENLRRKAEEEDDISDIICQYRVKNGASLSWVEEQICFIRQDDAVVVNILGRDITEEKLRESKAAREKRERSYIIHCLSSLFFLTYYVDLEKDKFRIVKQIDEVGNVLGSLKNYNEAIGTYSQHFIHPDDRGEFIEKMNCQNLKKELSPQRPFITMEYHKIRRDEGNTIIDDGWILATAILAESENGVPKKVVYVEQNVTESKEQAEWEHRMLKEACDAANHANAAKSEFLSRVSHDIRTPLNAIIGMTTIAGRHLNDCSRVADCLNKITVSSKHLLSLINEVLDMSKIESGKIDLTEEEFNLTGLIENVLTMIRPAINEKEHVFDVHIEKMNIDEVTGDSTRVRQVLMNILGNAVKYTPSGGRIQFYVSEKPSRERGYGRYEFIVEDNGIGMDEEFLERIFEPFSRAEDTRTNKIEGTGLGMAIAINIVHMMNGEIQVESKVNQGSRFIVTIFLKQRCSQASCPEQPAPKPEFAISETSDKKKIFDENQPAKRILLVDDNEINREIAVEIIGSTGVIVECAENGKEAFDKFVEMGELYYDLIFMDVQMPIMNGYEATRAIRLYDRADAKKIPIIAMTANAFTEDVMASREAGMNEHVAKPLNVGQLMECMQRWLGQ